MKLSCLPVSFFSDILDGKMSIRDWAQMGGEPGIGCHRSKHSVCERPLAGRVVENAPGNRRRRNAHSHDNQLPGLYASQPPAKAKRAGPRARSRRGSVGVGRRVGCRCHSRTGTPVDRGRADGIEWAVEGLTNLVTTTRHTGIWTVYENHAKPGAWQYTDFSQPPDIFMEIFRPSLKRSTWGLISIWGMQRFLRLTHWLF